MAKLENAFSFTGPVGNLSAYKRKDIDKIILRTKGGATKEKIRTNDAFVNVRRNNAEFGGRATAIKYIRKAIWPLKELADYNFTSQLMVLLKAVQQFDSNSEFGKRSVNLSVLPQLLNGFNLNRKIPFDSIIRNPLTAKIVAQAQAAVVEVPALLPGINFFAFGKYPVYSIVVSLGYIPDVVHNGNGYAPYEAAGTDGLLVHTSSGWLPVTSASPAIKLALQLPGNVPQNGCLVLGVGIRFGTMLAGGRTEQARYAGAAKIMAVAALSGEHGDGAGTR